MVINMLTELRRTMDEHRENFNQETENINEPIRGKEYDNWNKKYTRVVQQKLDDA